MTRPGRRGGLAGFTPWIVVPVWPVRQTRRDGGRDLSPAPRRGRAARRTRSAPLAALGASPPRHSCPSARRLPTGAPAVRCSFVGCSVPRQRSAECKRGAGSRHSGGHCPACPWGPREPQKTAGLHRAGGRRLTRGAGLSPQPPSRPAGRVPATGAPQRPVAASRGRAAACHARVSGRGQCPLRAGGRHRPGSRPAAASGGPGPGVCGPRS